MRLSVQKRRRALVIIGIRIVKECKKETWISSFARVNLHPTYRKPFPEFMKKISQFIRGGTQFVEEDLYPSPAKKFKMLPQFWKGMQPSERRVAMTILNSHGGKYTSQCLRALKTECKLNLNQLTEIRVCMIIAKEHPETLDMDLDDIENESGANESTDNNPEIYSNSDPQAVTMEEARAEDQNLNKCLDYYQLNPKDSSGKQKFSGEALLNHMCGYRNREFAKEGSTDDDRTSKPPSLLEPSPYLDVHLYDDSLRAIKPTKQDFLRGNAMSHAHGIRAQRKMAERKLTNIGTVVGHCGVVNSDENLRKLRDSLEFAKSFAEIKRVQETEKKQKGENAQKDFEKNAPAAVRKLEKKDRNLKDLNISEIEAILFRVYNVAVEGARSKLRKVDYVKRLEKVMSKNIEKYELFLSSLAHVQS